MKKMTFEKFEELFKNLDDERQFDYWNDLCDKYCYEEWVYPMEDIDELLGDKKPSEVLSILDNKFDYTDAFIYFDAYGWLNSLYTASDFFENDRGDIKEIYDSMDDDELQEFAEEADPDYNEEDWEDEE